MAELSDLEARLGHTFRAPALLRLAVTHPSVAHENDAKLEHNQRLEFLGDAVLQLALTEELFARFPDLDEGALTQARARLANSRSLAGHARALDLGAHLILSRGEEGAGGRTRDTALTDAFEAVIGAVYLDGGWEAARAMVKTLFHDGLRDAPATDAQFNPKGELQERLQALGPEPIRYRVERAEGPDHRREFEVSVHHRGEELGRGVGRSKKEAESRAALAALEKPGAHSPAPPSPPST